MNDEPQFWMVWNPQGRAPTMKHGTWSEARGEAERLARINAGQSFYVLRAECKYSKVDVVCTDLTESGWPDSPF